MNGETSKRFDLAGSEDGGLVYVRVELFFERAGGVFATSGEVERALVEAS